MSPSFPFTDIDRPIAHRFEAFARRHPDRIAVRSRSGQTTYGELNRWADRIADSIVALDAGEVVAVMAGKHAAGIVAALLGVLKAGRIHVALDPAASAEQNRLVLADSGAAMLLADDVNLAPAQRLACSGCKVARIAIRGRGVSRGEPRAGIAAAAGLLIYTSGSTGRPKGVLTDRFIDLGGDSLQAGRIAAGVNSTFGVDIELVSLFEVGTVEDMASMVAHAITRRSAAARPQS